MAPRVRGAEVRVVDDLVREVLGPSGSRNKAAEGGAGAVKELLDALRGATGEARRLESHFLARRDKLVQELRRLGSTRAAKEKDGKGEEQTRAMAKHLESIEGRVERVSNLSSHAGDRLVRLERRRDFARESKVLLGYLSNFSETEGCAAGCANRGEETLDRLDEFEAATLAIKLRALGEKLLVRTGDLDVPPTASPVPGRRRTELATIVERIQVYCDKLENRLILGFDKFSRHKNFARMRECSRCLLLFQGGARLTSHYLASRPLFLETNPKTLEEEASAAASSDSGGPKATKQLMDLLGRWYKHGLESVKKERQVINEVFPNADRITNELVRRLFEQNVQSYLAAVLAPSRAAATAARRTAEDIRGFLRVAAAAYEKTRELAAGLQTIGCGGIDVEARMGELFSEHLDSYPEVEFELLEALYASLRAKHQGKVLGCEMVVECFEVAKESIARCQLLSLEQDRADSVQKMFSSDSSRYASPHSLVDVVYQYMIGGLQSAMDSSEKACSSLSSFSLMGDQDAEALHKKVVGTSLGEVFAVVGTLSKCVSNLEQGLREDVLDAISPEALRDKCEDYLVSFIGLLEGTVAQALSMSVSNCLQVLARVLKARQKRADFSPQDDDFGMGAMGKATPACIVAVGCIRAVHKLCLDELGEPNAAPFMTELGYSIMPALRNHFGSFAYNPQGALRLKRDLAEYAEAFKSVGAPGVSRQYDDLSEQANLLVVMPESIPDLVEEDLKISPSEVLFWMKLRADHKTARLGDGKQTLEAYFSTKGAAR